MCKMDQARHTGFMSNVRYYMELLPGVEHQCLDRQALQYPRPSFPYQDEGVIMSNGVPEEPENIKAKQHSNNNHNHHRHHHHNNNNNNNNNINNNNKLSNKQVLIEDTMQVNNAEANPTTTTTSSTSSCLSSSSSSSSSSIISSPDEKTSTTTTTTSGGSGVTPRLVGGAAAPTTALAIVPKATMDSEEIGQRSTLSIQNRDKQQMIQVKSDASLLAQTSSQSESMEHFNLLQSQLGLSTQQLQHLVQNQSFQTKPSADQTRKQLEHLLQMNLFQQAHLINGTTSEKLPGSLRNLQAQQQDLMTQLHGGKPMGVDRNGPSLFPSKTFPVDQPKREPQGSHPLYSHGICRWTGCETPFPSFKEFKMHIDKDHVLSDRSTAQTRVQVQIVSQLEIQLKKEKDRLNAMMSHLHPTKNGKHFQDQEEDQKPILKPHHEGLIGGAIGGGDDNRPMDTSFNGLSALQSLALPFHALGGNPGPMGRGPLLGLNSNGLTMPHRSGELKVEKGLPKLQIQNSPYHQSHLEDYCSRGPRNQDGRSGSGSNLDIENEISRNREFYRTNDVRPPFTYAALIRQGIIESPDRQLTLNEIYTWFQNTFAYFRRNAATWKNAVRHNLSLHKCFMRVENVKGAVWTVDELEYHRRRPQRGANAGSGSSVGSSSSASRSPPFNSSPSMHFNGNDMAHHYPLGGLTLAEQQAAYLHGLGISLNSSLEVARSPSPRSHHSMGQHFNSRSPRRVENFMRNQHHNNRSQSRSPMPLSPPSSSSHDMYALEQARHAHGHHPSMRFSRSNPSPRPSDPSDFLVIKEEFGHENSESNETGMDDGQTATASRSNSFTPPESPRDEDREPTPEDLSKNRPMSPGMEEDQP